MEQQPVTKKYEFTGETKQTPNGTTVRQIRRLKDGAIGGWIEAEKNLSHDGAAWVYGDAQVSGAAWVSGAAQVSGAAWVYGDAQVSGAARVSGDAWVYGAARVSGAAWVYGAARVSGAFDFLHVAGLPYSVTILNTGHMSIGCMTKTFAEWRALTVDQQRSMNPDQFDKTRTVLLPLIDLMDSWIAAKVTTQPVPE